MVGADDADRDRLALERGQVGGSILRLRGMRTYGGDGRRGGGGGNAGLKE